jgi:hypothetical protein
VASSAIVERDGGTPRIQSTLFAKMRAALAGATIAVPGP